MMKIFKIKNKKLTYFVMHKIDKNVVYKVIKI